MGQSASDGRRERAQSAVLGLALVFGLVVASSVLVVVMGSTLIEDRQTDADIERAHKTLTQFDSQAALVALGDSGVQSVALARSGGATYSVDNESGWMNVSVTNVTSGTTTTVMNATLGAVVYTNERTTIAYQGGGVWARRNDGATMVSPPEFYYRDATLTLPLVTVTGDATIDGRVTVDRNGSSVKRYPNTTADDEFRNPLKNGKVNVTVSSDYYEAWGRYFERRTDGNVTYNHTRETARMTLVVPAGDRTVAGAVAASSSGGDIELSGSGDDPARTDSYNSTLGSYSATKAEDGTVATAGDLKLSGNSMVNGSVRSGGSVEVKGSSEVKHDVFYTDSVTVSGTVGGQIEQISGVESADPIDTHVESRYDNISANPDSDPDISGTQLDSGDTDLGPGQYHLEEISLDGETLTLDTGSGERVEIAVRDSVALENGAEIRVVGSGEAKLYVKGENTGLGGKHLYIDTTGGVVDVDDDQNATQFWVYGKQDFQAEIDGSDGSTHRFEGVIYAPAGLAGTSSFAIDHGELFGGVVTGDVDMDNGGAVHYDTSLNSMRAVPRDTTIVRVTYLHVSENRVVVTDG